MTFVTDLMGATGLILEKGSFSAAFFRPYQSTTDFIFRTGSIVTAPLVLGGLSLFDLLTAGYEILKAIGNALSGNMTEAGNNMRECDDCIYNCAVSFIAALASPILNLIDVLGGILYSLADYCFESDSYRFI